MQIFLLFFVCCWFYFLAIHPQITPAPIFIEMGSNMWSNGFREREKERWAIWTSGVKYPGLEERAIKLFNPGLYCTILQPPHSQPSTHDDFSFWITQSVVRGADEVHAILNSVLLFCKTGNPLISRETPRGGTSECPQQQCPSGGQNFIVIHLCTLNCLC